MAPATGIEYLKILCNNLQQNEQLQYLLKELVILFLKILL